jgi:hypothetical protein
MTKANIGNSQVVIKIGRNTVLKAYRGSNVLYNPISVPTSPTNVAVSISGKDAIISFSAPSSNGGSAITNYIVQYSSNNGNSWNNFVAPTDSYFSNVSLLLRMNGNNNSFFDSSTSTKTVTAVGNVIQSSNQSKWGGKSGYFDGNIDRLTIPDHESLYFGNQDYAVEAWLYIPSLNTSGGGYFFSQANNISDNNNRQFAFAVNSQGLLVYWTINGISDQSIVFAVNVPVNQWFHVAFSRTSGILRAYLNGIQVGNSQSHNVTYFNSTADICVGSFGKYAENGYSSLDFAGYINDLRVTVGSSRGYSGSTITLPQENITGSRLEISSPVTVNTLSYSRSYIFRVIAVNSVGSSSPSNSSSSITTPLGIVGNLYGQFKRGGQPSDAEMLAGNFLSTPLSSPSLYSSIDYGENDDNYGFMAIGYFIPPTTGTYTFYTSSDDGSAVWVGSIAEATSGRSSSNMVVNNNVTGYQANTERSGSISLIAGTVYAIRIIHREGDGGDNLRFSWAGPSISKRTSLATYFYANNFGSEPPEILSVSVESYNSYLRIIPTLSSSNVTYFTISYSSDNGNNWTTFGNGQTAYASSVDVTGLTNGVNYKIRITATNSLGTSEEYITENYSPNANSISPLSLSNGFLSSLRSDTISEAEYPNAALANGYLSVLRINDTISEAEYPNAVLANGYLSSLHIDPIAI